MSPVPSGGVWASGAMALSAKFLAIWKSSGSLWFSTVAMAVHTRPTVSQGLQGNPTVRKFHIAIGVNCGVNAVTNSSWFGPPCVTNVHSVASTATES